MPRTELSLLEPLPNEAAPYVDRGGRHAAGPAPLLWLTAGLLVGQALAPLLPGLTPALALGLGGAMCIGCRRTLVRLAAPNTRHGSLCLGSAPDGGAARERRLLLGAALVAAALGHLQVDRLLQPTFAPDHIQRFAGASVEVRGSIADRPSRRPSQTRFLIETSAVYHKGTWQPAHGRISATVRYVQQAWQRGDRLRGAFQLRRPRNFGNPGEFDYESYLARRHVYVTGYAASDRSWERQVNRSSGFWERVERWRTEVSHAIDDSLDGPAAPIVAALLIGEAPALPPDIRDRYARAGVSHVLAISGLHVGLVAAAAYAGARWLLSRSEWLLLRTTVPKLAMALTTLPILLYAAIAGGSVATARAVFMVLLFLTATLINRQRNWLASLAAAAAAISLCWPGSLFEISFQLSFMAVLAIVLGMQRVTEWWDAWEEEHLIRLRGPHWRLVRRLVLYQAVTVCALLGTAPLTAWHFNRLSLIGLAANPLVVPLLGLLPVSLGLVSAIALPIAPSFATVLLQIAGALVDAADWVVGICAGIPGASVRTVSPSLGELLLIYGLFATPLVRQRKRRHTVLVLCSLLLAADVAYWYASRFHRTDLKVTFLSVGHGDSSIIEFPGSSVMVIDGGGLSTNFDTGERIVGPYLWRRKIGKVDTLVLSHPDFDHYGGLEFLTRAFAPHSLWWNGYPGGGSRFAEFWRTVERRRVPTLMVRRGFRCVIGGVEVTALHPDAATTGDANNRSLTLRLRYGPTTLLFPGDLEDDGERALVIAHRQALESFILKVPHHGSRTSSSAPFLNAVSPTVAIFSSGYGNRFRLPDSGVVEAYRRRGAEVWRTDDDGAIVVRATAEGTVTIVSGRGRHAERRVLSNEQ